MVKYWHHVVPAENLHRDGGFSNLIIAQIRFRGLIWAFFKVYLPFSQI